MHWIPAADDFLAAASLSRQYNATTILLLGNDTQSVTPATLAALAGPIAGNTADLVLPRFHLGPHEGLVNAAMIYPLTAALFAQAAHFPLPLDCALSPRFAARLGITAQKFTAASQPDALLWPVAEAAVANVPVREASAPGRILPQPPGDNIAAVLNIVLGSLFSDIESKASFWQRARLTPHQTAAETAFPQASTPPSPELLAELTNEIEAFRNAFTNLRELWSIVLPPNSLLALKKLSVASIEAFHMPASLWARIVYDFLLAWRLRTLNRGHLLGAFTPLYFAWVASHLITAQNDPTRAAAHTKATVAAFENEKPYIVARWRWPDRFNP